MQSPRSQTACLPKVLAATAIAASLAASMSGCSAVSQLQGAVQQATGGEQQQQSQPSGSAGGGSANRVDAPDTSSWEDGEFYVDGHMFKMGETTLSEFTGETGYVLIDGDSLSDEADGRKGVKLASTDYADASVKNEFILSVIAPDSEEYSSGSSYELGDGLLTGIGTSTSSYYVLAGNGNAADYPDVRVGQVRLGDGLDAVLDAFGEPVNESYTVSDDGDAPAGTIREAEYELYCGNMTFSFGDDGTVEGIEWAADPFYDEEEKELDAPNRDYAQVDEKFRQVDMSFRSEHDVELYGAKVIMGQTTAADIWGLGKWKQTTEDLTTMEVEPGGTENIAFRLLTEDDYSSIAYLSVTVGNPTSSAAAAAFCPVYAIGLVDVGYSQNTATFSANKYQLADLVPELSIDGISYSSTREELASKLGKYESREEYAQRSFGDTSYRYSYPLAGSSFYEDYIMIEFDTTVADKLGNDGYIDNILLSCEDRLSAA